MNSRSWKPHASSGLLRSLDLWPPTASLSKIYAGSPGLLLWNLGDDLRSLASVAKVTYPIGTFGFDAEQLNLEFPNTVGPFVRGLDKSDTPPKGLRCTQRGLSRKPKDGFGELHCMLIGWTLFLRRGICCHSAAPTAWLPKLKRWTLGPLYKAELMGWYIFRFYHVLLNYITDTLYYIILYYIILYYIILYSILLHYIILYYIRLD